MTLPQEAILRQQLQQKTDSKTKPPGSLGRLEEIALRIGLIQETDSPEILRPHIVVFAGDHGIALTGLVNPYPQAVTAQMVLNFLRGGAAINVFCRLHSVGLKVVDAGVNFDFESTGSPDFIPAKIAYGTRNYLDQEAMSREEMQKALAKGREIVRQLSREGCNCIGPGEMGIGNTSSAALIMHRITGIPLMECTGKGTGTDDRQLARKIATLQKVADRHFPENHSPIATASFDRAAASILPHDSMATSSPQFAAAEDILQKVGGFEIAMMTGACLEAAALKMVLVVDGFIATAALLLAHSMDGSVTDHCIFAHASGEQGHRKMLDYLCARPLLDLGLRLGEGTGAALALPLIRSAVAFLKEMASFESAAVSGKAEKA